MWKLKSLSKITSKLRTLSDGVISLSSNLTGKWLESLCRCCFVPIIVHSVLSELDIDLCVSDCEFYVNLCVISIHMMTDVVISNS